MHKLQTLVKDAPDIYDLLREQLSSWQSTDELAQSCAITFMNPYSYLLLRRSPEVLEQLTAVYCDAITSARLSSLCLGKTIPRISFDYGSLAKTFFTQLDKYKVPMYFFGSDPDALERSYQVFTQSYPNLKVVGKQHGYYAESEYISILQQIVASGAKFVVIGLGTPKQDQAAVDLVRLARTEGKHIHCFTCGGFLTQSADKLQYYPEWINRFHLRWLWRVLHERHVLGRLLKEYPKFFGKFIKDLYSGRRR